MSGYFDEVFGVAEAELDAYGAFNISLVNDLPLFIDPFLLFHSQKSEYQELHEGIVNYLAFLRDNAKRAAVDVGLQREWFYFPEVKQNWFGYSETGCSGRGLGRVFANHLLPNIATLLSSQAPQVTKGRHVEKLALVRSGVGRDSISDLTTNLIKGYLCEYTERFARARLSPSVVSSFPVEKAVFNPATELWAAKSYDLPVHRGDYVLLTPKDLLTKDDTWISRNDLENRFGAMLSSLPNEHLRARVNNYLSGKLSKKSKAKDVAAAQSSALDAFPELVEYYIRLREEQGDQATSVSSQKVEATRKAFVEQVKALIRDHLQPAGFYDISGDAKAIRDGRLKCLQGVFSQDEALSLLKDRGEAIQSESDLRLILRIIWHYTDEDDLGELPPAVKASWPLLTAKLGSSSQLERGVKSALADPLKEVAIFAFNENQAVAAGRVMARLHGLESERVTICGVALKGPAARKGGEVDFFVSYTGADAAWAEWVALELERLGFSTVVQCWDFLPGSSFVDLMHKATQSADRTIAILTPEYLESAMAAKEWQAALLQDADVGKRKLIPVRVKDFKPSGLLEQVVYIDLVGKNKSDARLVLKKSLSQEGPRDIAHRDGVPYPG
ncbi:toll/interleukin-1 receptor domain-containing protein [Alienimonas californiensis]|uniref:TIR domain-containing protein n=1 Tax=Alienimonas californiensis TaxID=2527989 RepID=A0A517P4Z6_9PLAN|nr:toll/interleukin-1 receptor domain-containing protein [Alienimonas californiensis]QDT14431.1 hypothetical protein CA12_05040 [Alienimonas californiensis]